MYMEMYKCITNSRDKMKVVDLVVYLYLFRAWIKQSAV